jgi:hypothetical protein
MANQLIRAVAEEWQRAKTLKRMYLDRELRDRLVSFLLAVEYWMVSFHAHDLTSPTLIEMSLQAAVCGMRLWAKSYHEHCKQCATSV